MQAPRVAHLRVCEGFVARESFAHLALYDEAVLQSWYDLYETGKSEHFARLRRAASTDEVSA